MDAILLIANGLGLLAALTGIIAARSHDKRGIMIGNALVNIILVLQLGLLGAYVAALLNIVNTTRILAAMRTSSTAVMLFFMVLTCLPCLAMASWVDALPVLGSLISTYGYFKLDKHGMRYVLVGMNLLWAPVMVYYGAYITAVHYTGVLLSATYAIIRDHRNMLNSQAVARDVL